jgi:SAM-dependent methyltransferase
MPTSLRTKYRTEFAQAVASREVKIQVGARGKKNGETWTAIDLFDKSDLIDHNWDIQDLPLNDEVVDCFVCNAILEHVPRPELAVYEMYRTLKVGGMIWVEVPFMQFFHAHPHDYMRWTLPGIKILLGDFEEVGSGIASDAVEEVSKYIHYANTDAKLPRDEQLERIATDYVAARAERWSDPRFYSSVFFWGKKATDTLPKEKVAYMESLKTRL